METSQAFETEASYPLNQEGLHTGLVLDFKPAAKLLARTEIQFRGRPSLATCETSETAVGRLSQSTPMALRPSRPAPA